MKTSTERLLIAGILVSGLVAFWAHSAGASSSEAPMPATFYPLLPPLERAFVWNESQNSTGEMMAGRESIYLSTVLPDGSHLSAAALAALAAEAVAKMTPEQIAARAP